MKQTTTQPQTEYRQATSLPKNSEKSVTLLCLILAEYDLKSGKLSNARLLETCLLKNELKIR